MKTIFNNGVCIILYDDSSFHPEHSDTSRVTGYVGFNALLHAYEVWVYTSTTKRFYSYKCKSSIMEAVNRMAKLGINLRVLTAKDYKPELSFETPKDEFHFNLKFL